MKTGELKFNELFEKLQSDSSISWSESKEWICSVDYPYRIDDMLGFFCRGFKTILHVGDKKYSISIFRTIARVYVVIMKETRFIWFRRWIKLVTYRFRKEKDNNLYEKLTNFINNLEKTFEHKKINDVFGKYLEQKRTD